MELEWQQEHLKEGKYNINMSYIDKKIQEIVKDIIAKEFEEATIQTKNRRRQERSFDSHLSAIKKSYISAGIPCTLCKKELYLNYYTIIN